MENIISLPFPTSSTQTGPVIYAHNASLRLKYDYQHDDGAIEWTEIGFEEVLAYRFCQSICGDGATKMNHIVESSASTWLSATVSRWEQAVGWQEYQISLGGKLRFKHYTINFDDDGIFDVICSTFR